MSFAQDRHEAEQFAIWDHVRRCRLDLVDAKIFAVGVEEAKGNLRAAIRAAHAAGLVDEFGVERAA